MFLINELGLAYRPCTKNASTSINKLLCDELNIHAKYRWKTLDSMYKFQYQDMSLLKNVFKFCVVRNPWQRIVSAYLEFLRALEYDQSMDYNIQNVKRLLGSQFNFERFVYFVTMENEYIDVMHWATQYSILINYCKTWDFEYDLIIKLENINNEFSKVKENTLIKGDLPVENVKPSYNYIDFYGNDNVVNMVGDFYDKDIKEFNYAFGD